MRNEKVRMVFNKPDDTDVLDLTGLTADDLKSGKKQPDGTQNTGGNGNGGGTTKTPEQIEAERVAAEKLQASVEIAKKFGGTKLDDKGNAVDDTGKVIKTADEIAKANQGSGGNEPEAVEIEGKQYKLDKDGNALGEDGKVFKTKAELDALEEIEDEVPLVVELIQKSGYTIKDATGKIKEYEDSPEGLIEWTKDVAEHLATERDKKIFSQFPDVEDYLKHRQRGGNPNEYFEKQSNSWLNVKLDLNDEGMLKKAVVDNLLKTGMPLKDAEATANLYKDTNKLKEFGENAYKTLVKNEKETKDKQEQAYRAEQQRFIEENEKYWNNTNEVIKKGKFHTISIPEAEKEPFFKFISQAVDENGNSEAAYKRDKLTLEQRLELDYILYKGLDLSTLISLAASKKQVEGLRKRFSGKQKGAGGGQGTGHEGVNRNPNSANISIDTIT